MNAQCFIFITGAVMYAIPRAPAANVAVNADQHKKHEDETSAKVDEKYRGRRRAVP